MILKKNSNRKDGNLEVLIFNCADHHGVPLKYIEAVDKTKIPKTQKRPGGKKR